MPRVGPPEATTGPAQAEPVGTARVSGWLAGDRAGRDLRLTVGHISVFEVAVAH